MTGSIAHVLRSFATTPGEADRADRGQFLEAARMLFDLDPELKRKPWSRRNRILNLPADTAPQREKIEALLRECIKRVIEAGRTLDRSDSAESVLLGRRILAAYVIARGLPARQDQVELLRATILLHKLNEDAQASNKAERARKARALDGKRGARKAEWKALRDAAAELRSSPNAPPGKTDRARVLTRQLRARLGPRTPKALMELARRHHIEI